MNFDQLHQLWLQSVPGAATNTDPNAFNNWTQQISNQQGVSGWENIDPTKINLGSFSGSPTGSNTANNIFGSGTVNSAQDSLNTVAGNAAGGNSSQVQGGQQSGNYSSTGTTGTTGTQNQQNATSGTTTNNQSQTGTTSGTQLGSSSTGSNTQQQGATTGSTNVNDTLGFGSLLKGQQGAATANTNTDNSFLSNLVKNGPAQQQALTAQAVNQATSGPGMVGAGDNAGARAAGYAASNVGLNSLGQQLQGAAQLAGPTATTTLANAANPYLGTNTSGTSSQAGSNITTGQTAQNSATTTDQALQSLESSTGLSNLLNNTSTNTNEGQSGTAGGSSLSIGAGNAPEAQTTTSGGGGCYACTALIHLGMMHKIALVRGGSYKYGNKKYERSLAGYSLYGPWLARLILAWPWFAKVFRPIARVILYEEVRLSGRHIPRRLDASFWHFLFNRGSWVLAVVTGRRKARTDDPKIEQLLRSQGVYWEVK